MTVELRIRLLGGLHLSLGDEPVAGFVSGKAPALLAYLAVTGRPHQRDTLAALLWGEMADADARNNLRQALSSLRRRLQPFLWIERDEVALAPGAPVYVDATAFLAAVGRGDYERAAALYEGDFLEGVFVRDAPAFEEWALAQRARFRELALQALHRLIDAQMGRAMYDEAIVTATRLLALDSWREEAHRQLMLALARTGQRGAALAQFETCRRVIRDAFDMEPSDETAALAARIRAAQRGPRHNLPAAVTGFVGREAELARLRELLASPVGRLITLVGPGGAGKTRLALEAAAAATEQFLHGAWWVSLAAVDPAQPDGVPLAINAALGLAATSTRAPRRQLEDLLRARELLIVLDNLEHLHDEAAWLSTLLAAAPDLRLLVTSRERLDLQAERVIDVGGLNLVGADGSPEPADAVVLFARRARRVQAGFTLEGETGADVARICRQLGGSPLAIELAAAWAHRLPPAAIAAAIEDSLDFLNSTRRDMPARQRSLRAIFDYAWARLSSDEKVAYPALTLFRGGFTLEAAAAVVGAGPDLLAALVDRALLRLEMSGRYALHETLAHYAGEQLALMPERAAAARRHSAYYAGLLQAREAQFKGPAQKQVLAELAPESENIRAAWRTALDEGWRDILATAAEGLYHYYSLRGWLGEGVEVFRAARELLEAGEGSGDGLALARVVNAEAKFLLTLGEYDAAEPLLQRNLAALERGDAPAELATALCHLGHALVARGRLDDGEARLRRSAELRRALGDDWGAATSILEWARIAYVRQEFAGCQELCREGLALAERAGDRQLIAHFLTGMSLIGRELGDIAGAEEKVGRSLAVYAELGDPYGLIQGYLTLGGLLLHQGRHDEARPWFEKAVAGGREIGFRSGEADGLHRLAWVAAGRGEWAAAAHGWRQALQLALELGDEPLILEILFEAGRAFGRNDGATAGLLAWLAAQTNLGEMRRAEARQWLIDRAEPAEAPPRTMDEAAAVVFALLAGTHPKGTLHP